MSRTKYNVDKNTNPRTCNGITFDSVVEKRYYEEIILPAFNSKEITHYELQKTYELQPKFKHDGKTVRAINYVADFFVLYKDGTSEVIDIKGCPDSVSKMKRKMFWYKYPDIKYSWICWSKIDGGWCDYDFVKNSGQCENEKKRIRNKRRKRIYD